MAGRKNGLLKIKNLFFGTLNRDSTLFYWLSHFHYYLNNICKYFNNFLWIWVGVYRELAHEVPQSWSLVSRKSCAIVLLDRIEESKKRTRQLLFLMTKKKEEKFLKAVNRKSIVYFFSGLTSHLSLYCCQLFWNEISRWQIIYSGRIWSRLIILGLIVNSKI